LSFKSHFVLRALRILGLEEILKLSQVLYLKQIPLKKAAGEDSIELNNPSAKAASSVSRQDQDDAKVLNFPQKTIQDIVSNTGQIPERPQDEDRPNFLTSEMVLWQRELAKNNGENVNKLDAFKRYKKSTEMYVVKSPSSDGKDKIRFASTKGVLINKKQA
jgi:hypothetical protein